MFENAFSGGTFRQKIPNIFCMENVSGNNCLNFLGRQLASFPELIFQLKFDAFAQRIF
jgi:hypothetical protein